MNDILFGNDNAKTIRNLSKKYFRKNRGRNLAAVLAIALTAFLFTSVISLAFHMVSSLQLSMYMQKGSKADGTLGYMTEEQYRQLAGSDFVEQAGHRRVLTFASNAVGHSVEIDYADSVQQELTFCVPSHGTAPRKANEITTTDLALKALGVEPTIGAPVPVEFEVRGQTYHYDMVLSGWWEANNDTVSLMIVSEQFVVLRQKMATGDYVILGCDTDRATGKPAETPLTRQLGTGDRVSFYKNGELFRTCTILARANVVGTEREILTANTTEMNIGGDAPRLYMTEEMFGQLCDDPTLLSYGFDAAPGQEAQMDAFLNDLAEQDPSVAYTSTKLMKEQMASIRNVVLLVGGMIAAIMEFAGLINFTNMMVTSIITRRLEFATMQSIGMTGRQLRRLMVYEGLYYAAGADLIGGAAAAAFALTVLRNALNSPSMWFFSLRFTLMPALAVAAVYLFLASVIPVVALHCCNKGTVVDRLRI